MQAFDEFKTVAVTVDAGGVARVEMVRAAVYNAFDEVMIDELTLAFNTLAADSAVRAIVLSGQGKAFSAGADLQWMKRAAAKPYEENLADGRDFAAMLHAIYACPKPTIARVHGVALGGGMGLACACDMAIASEGRAVRRERSPLRHPAVSHRPLRHQRRRQAPRQATGIDGEPHRRA